MSPDQAVALLDAFAQAWNRHDADALVAMMTPDGVFETAGGQAPFGGRFAGHAELRKAFSAVWQAFPDASWNDATHVALGERGFSEWTFRGTGRDGKVIEARGVDLFVFRDGKIAKKDTFRKNVVK